MRPVVIPDTGVITLNVDARRADAFVTLDNRTYPVSHGASFTVERAEQTIFWPCRTIYHFTTRYGIR